VPENKAAIHFYKSVGFIETDEMLEDERVMDYMLVPGTGKLGTGKLRGFQEMNCFTVIETDRLLLRELTDEDASSILVYLSDDEVMKYYGLEPFTSLNDAA